MTTDEILAIFRECGALLEGHFILSSGLRSPVFLQKARVFMHPDKAESLCRALAEKIRAAGYRRGRQIVSPAVGGIIPGYETARHLGLPAIYTERVERQFRGPPRLRAGARRKGDRGRGHRLHGPLHPRMHRLPARDRRRRGRRRLPHRSLGRRRRDRRAAGGAGAVQGAGLSGRRAAARTCRPPGRSSPAAGGWRERRGPLIRSFGPPSPTRGAGERRRPCLSSLSPRGRGCPQGG